MLDRLTEQSRLPTGSGLESCSSGGVGDTEGGGLSGSGLAGCGWACGVRGTYGGGRGGSSTGSPWNIGFFFFFLLSFFLSGWATDTLLRPCPFMQSLAYGGSVCPIRSQESMYGNRSGCPGVPVAT